jgi:hypothetical protein
MENLGKFNYHLVYFSAIGNILWAFVIFSPLGILHQEKSGNPAPCIQPDCKTLNG